MIETVTFEKTTYNLLPMKFEAGTPMIVEVMGLGAAIDYVSGIGMESIRQKEHDLLVYATEHLQQIDKLRIIGTAANKGGIISFVVDGIHALDLGTLLDIHGVAVRTGHHCAQPTMHHFGVPSTVRASFGLYNAKEEVDSFVDILRDAIKILVG